MRFLLTACLLLVTAAAAACDDDDDNGDSLREDVQGARETLGAEVNEAFDNFADELDEAADQVESGDEDAASNIKQRCDNFVETIPVEAVRSQAEDICGDVEQAAEDQDGDRLRDLADRVRDLGGS
jgi:hypothetical protein